jgi:MFS family permease
MTALIEESSPPSRRGRNMGLVVSAAALVGLAAAPVLTTQVASRGGWRSAFFVAGIPGLLLGFVIWRFVKESAHADGGTEEKPSLRDYLSILLSQHVAVLSRRYRLYVLAVRAECVRTALHH